MVRAWLVGEPYPARGGYGAAEAPTQLGQASRGCHGVGGGRAGLDCGRICHLALAAIGHSIRNRRSAASPLPGI